MHMQYWNTQNQLGALFYIGLQKKLYLTFNEPVEIEFSKIDLLDVEDKIIISGIRPIAMQNKNSITIPIPLLTYGIYFVEFQVLSIDGHKVKGRYKFTIKNIN